MEKEICNVIYNINGINKNATIELTENEDSVETIFKSNDLVIEKKSLNYFDALIEIRKELEKRKIKLLCKGCARNVYPSGMMLSMGMGRKAYTLIIGEQAKMNSTVDIFAPCSIEEYGTIEQQILFFDKWSNSLMEL